MGRDHVMGRESVTRLLRRWSAGDSEAFDELMEQIYDELHVIAGQCFRRERPEHTLQPTALLHEAVLRLMELDELDWHDRSHFFAVAARMMRRILVDHARQHRRQKRGGDADRVSLSEAESMAVRGKRPDLDELDAALERLEARDPRKAQIVELRFFAGLKVDEVAEALEVSKRTVEADWTHARAWLRRELSQAGAA